MPEPALHVDRYELFEPIARGGMATVYFARQRGAGGFAKAVAIKRMRPDLAEEREFVDMFVDEARLASRIRHANVVGVIDVVRTGEELLLVMEYLHGMSLSRLLGAAKKKGQPVPPAVAVAIVADVLHGLHAAHITTGADGTPLGIVHRDVSPQNILVGVDGVTRVVDFGIARAAGQLHATDEGKTRGKTAYSSPEQLRGTSLTPRSDVFSTMIVLWEALVGRQLFDAESPAATMHAVLTQPIDPPGIHVPTLPQELDDAIMSGLEREPSARPATALAMAVALEKALAPASPAEVAAWVRDLASPELAARSAIVNRIEGATTETPSMRTTAERAAVDATPTVLDRAAAPPARRKSGAWIALLLALAAVAAFGLFVRAKGTSSSRAEPNAAPTVPSVAASPPPPASDVPPTPPSSASTIVATSARAPAASARPQVRAAPRSAPAAPRASAKQCDPPYVVDSAGHKVFKTECL